MSDVNSKKKKSEPGATAGVAGLCVAVLVVLGFSAWVNSADDRNDVDLEEIRENVKRASERRADEASRKINEQVAADLREFDLQAKMREDERKWAAEEARRQQEHREEMIFLEWKLARTKAGLPPSEEEIARRRAEMDARRVERRLEDIREEVRALRRE
jgi:translation elongation factor EF-1beta